MNQQEKNSLKLEILEKITALATAAFGLVAALAWNSAIQDLFAALYPVGDDSIVAKFFYAVSITAVVVVLIALLGRSMDRLKAKIK